MSGMDDLVEAIQLSMESKGKDINTSIPGTVVSYDAKTNRARVRPMLPKKLANNQVILPPEIVQVPIIFPASGMAAGGKQAGISLPIAPGDGVMLSFQQRSIENWLSGNNDAPDDPRIYDLSDCVATPGLNSAGFVGDAENMVIRMDKASVVLKPDNTIVFGNENSSITLDPSGAITIKGVSISIDVTGDINLKASGIMVDAGGRQFQLEKHVHRDTQAGPGLSGEPLG